MFASKSGPILAGPAHAGSGAAGRLEAIDFQARDTGALSDELRQIFFDQSRRLPSIA
jgi:hypothetical protein